MTTTAEDETTVETVGACCNIYKKYMFGQPWFQWRNRCTGANGGWESTQQTARENAVASEGCTPASAIYILVKNSVTGSVLEDIRVCLGLMCTQTAGTGETYIGRYAYGTYGLSIAATGYENLVDTVVVEASEYHLTRQLVPTGGVIPGEGCDGVPSWLKPFCILFSGFITTAITAFNAAVITPIQKFQDDAWKVTLDMYGVVSDLVAGLAAETQARIDSLTTLDASLRTWASESISNIYAEVETKLISPLLASINELWADIGGLWATCEEIIAAAGAEAVAWREKVTKVDLDIRAWIESSIIDIIWAALTREKKAG